jgi:tetratricopeptide (TPR) repeat protein
MSAPWLRPWRAGVVAAVSAALVLSRGAFALGPFEKNHPKVQEGITAYEQGRFEDALKAFDDARAELPTSAELQLDRAKALYKLGRVDEAVEIFRNTAQAGPKPLRARAFYDLGTALAESGRKDEALDAFRKALLLDPKDEQARHNLEVLLRNPPPPKQHGPDGGEDGGQDGGNDAGPPQPSDAGRDGGQKGGRGDAGQDGGQDAGQDGGEDGGQRQEPQTDGGTPDAGDEPEGEPSPGSMSKQEVEKLLDSMKQNEKNLQLWRFQEKKRGKKQNEKDW